MVPTRDLPLPRTKANESGGSAALVTGCKYQAKCFCVRVPGVSASIVSGVQSGNNRTKDKCDMVEEKSVKTILFETVGFLPKGRTRFKRNRYWLLTVCAL